MAGKTLSNYFTIDEGSQFSSRRNTKGSTAKTIQDVCRGLQLIVGIGILVLSIFLTKRWQELNDQCGSSSNKECDKIAVGLGCLKYCIAVGSWILFDIVVWAVDTFCFSLPWCVIYVADQLAGGLALGGGCTLAALINGWSCASGSSGGQRLCKQLYADIALLYIEVILAWTGLVAWCYVKKHYQPDAHSRMS